MVIVLIGVLLILGIWIPKGYWNFSYEQGRRNIRVKGEVRRVKGEG